MLASRVEVAWQRLGLTSLPELKLPPRGHPTWLGGTVLLGDFMRPNPVIAVELRRFQLAGVPLLLVYPRAAAQSPLVLPASRTSGTALGALNAAAKYDSGDGPWRGEQTERPVPGRRRAKAKGEERGGGAGAGRVQFRMERTLRATTSPCQATPVLALRHLPSLGGR
jgi:hypothetical protein